MFTKNNDGNDYLSLYRDNSGHRTTYLEASVTYDRQFVDAHRVGALFLYNMKERKDNFPGNYIASLPYKPWYRRPIDLLIQRQVLRGRQLRLQWF